MNEIEAKTVGDLRNLVQDGEKRIFEARLKPGGNEPGFYTVATRGEFSRGPYWKNDPQNNRPTPSRRGMPYIALSSLGEYSFAIESDRKSMADLYQFAPCLYLVSDVLRDVLRVVDPHSFESAPAIIAGRESIEDFAVVMPTRVLDAVDIAKTEVTVTRREPAPGVGRFVTHVEYNKGYFVRSDITDGVAHFIEEFTGPWLWRREIFELAAQRGIKSIFGAHTFKTDVRWEIRI